MIVYHGSNHRFKTFRIAKELVEHESTFMNEGLGIYFTTNPDIAAAYGKYLYTVEIPDDKVVDFRKRSECEEYYDLICSFVYYRTNVDVNWYVSPEMRNIVIDRMFMGGECIYKLGTEIYNILDSTEAFWSNELSDTKRNQIRHDLAMADKCLLNSYMFTYSIKNIGVIKKPGLFDAKILSVENVGQNLAM